MKNQVASTCISFRVIKYGFWLQGVEAQVQTILFWRRKNLFHISISHHVQEYEPMCITKNDCQPPALAYAIEAEVSGVPGRADRPHLVLHMSAILSDEYKLKLPSLENTASDKLDYPALRGQVPSYHVGKEIFQKFLNSIRIRPGAFVAKTNGNSPKAQALKD